MRTRVLRWIGSALAAASLLGALAATPASAASLEARPSFPIHLYLSAHTISLETVAGREVTCESGSGPVEYASGVELRGDLRLQGCFAERLPLLACGTGDPASGVISTFPLRISPVDLDWAHTEAGFLFEPATAGGLFATFGCVLGPVQETLEVKGSVIARVPTSELGEFRESLNLEFRAPQGKPEPSLVEGVGAPHVLLTEGVGTEPFPYEESGLQELLPGQTTLSALEGKTIALRP